MNKKHISVCLTLMIFIVFSLSGCVGRKKPDSINGSNVIINSENPNSGQENIQEETNLSGNASNNMHSETILGDDGEEDSSEYTSSDSEPLPGGKNSATASSATQSVTDVPKKDGGKSPIQYKPIFSTPTDLSGPSTSLTPSSPSDEDIPEMPWDTAGAKQPKEYTWLEFQNLTTQQKGAFAKTFCNNSEFQSWLNQKYDEFLNEEPDEENSGSVTLPEEEIVVKVPWENGGKLPNKYTYAEFEALTAGQQMAFQNWFESPEDFEKWLNSVKENPEINPEVIPWENGKKLPSEYTYAEYEALTAGQQMAFQKWFESPEAFDEWLNSAQENQEVIPWENGGKMPNEYTYAEFEALTAAQQMAFQNWFESPEAFEGWLNLVQENPEVNPWENGGKLPSEYTYADFEALTAAQQMAFQNWFESPEAFDAWLNSVQENPQVNPWENGGKLPSEYTYAEFEALTAAQQMAFQNWFGSFEAFDEWLSSVQENPEVIPWENGGKLPSEYTYAEFEALTAGQQMAFQNWFGSIEAFDEWLNSVQNP